MFTGFFANLLYLSRCLVHVINLILVPIHYLSITSNGDICRIKLFDNCIIYFSIPYMKPHYSHQFIKDVIFSCLHIHAFEFYGGNRLFIIKFANIIVILRKKE